LVDELELGGDDDGGSKTAAKVVTGSNNDQPALGIAVLCWFVWLSQGSLRVGQVHVLTLFSLTRHLGRISHSTNTYSVVYSKKTPG
jgi:hypothetical protein